MPPFSSALSQSSHSRRAALAVLVAAAPLGACADEPGTTTEDGSSSTSSTGAAETDPSTTEAPTAGTSTSDEPTTTEGESTTEAAEPTRIETILAALDTAMYACPNRIWPDVEENYRKRSVLLVSESENTGWLWNAQSGPGEPPRVAKGKLDQLPPEWSAAFNVGTLYEVLTLGISLDWTAEINDAVLAGGGVLWPDNAISLSFHEGFHFLSDQDDWNTGDGSRTAPYPEPWEPRYLRAALGQALLGDLQGEGSGLAAAAHWQSRLLAEHADEMEASRRYDITEGSAEYAALMMSALAEHGCEATDEELLATAISHLGDGNFLALESFSPGREFYDLGVLAGLLLRREGAQGWELAVEDGTPPVELALQGVAPADQPDDPALQKAAQDIVAARNEQIGLEIDPLLEHMKDPDYTRIAVDFNWIAGSFGLGGFYYLAEDPAQTDVYVRFEALLDPPSGVAIDVKELTVLVGMPTPCALLAGTTIVLTIPTADLAVAAGKATATGTQLTFAGLEVEAAADDAGLPWLCPLDAGGAGGAPAPSPGHGAVHELRAAPHQPTLYVP